MGTVNKIIENTDRTRFYGKRIGDLISSPSLYFNNKSGEVEDSKIYGDVIALSSVSDNMALVLFDGSFDPTVCETKKLTIEKKVEDRQDFDGVYLLAEGSHIFGQSNMGGTSGLIGKVTKCMIKGVVVYTREMANGIDSFQISSGERWGDKVGHTPSKARQALELCAPAEVWDEIAEVVKAADQVKRPVRKNKLFTIKWAEAKVRPVRHKCIK